MTRRLASLLRIGVRRLDVRDARGCKVAGGRGLITVQSMQAEPQSKLIATAPTPSTSSSMRQTLIKIPDDFWEPECIAPAWNRSANAWKRLIARFREYGILSADPMPTQAALVTMVSLVDKFEDSSDFRFALYWFLQASRFGRYSASGTTSLEEDLRDIAEASTLVDAVHRLLRRFTHSVPMVADDFMRDYSDSRFGRFLLYLLVYRNKAQDWDKHGHRVGFEGLALLSDFRPQWHHIFPKKYLEGHVDEDLVNALGNIAVIGPEINIRISARDPMKYITEYDISDQKLSQQFIDPKSISLSQEGYKTWVQERAHRLADVANDFIAEIVPPPEVLSGGLPL